MGKGNIFSPNLRNKNNPENSSGKTGALGWFHFYARRKTILYNDWPHLFILDLKNKDLSPRLFIENAFSPDIWYQK